MNNAMYPNMAVSNSTLTTNAKTEGRYDWETASVNAVPATVQSLLAHLNEELITQKNMIRAISENLHGKSPKEDAVPTQDPVCVLEALEDLNDRVNNNNLALNTIMNDLGIDC